MRVLSFTFLILLFFTTSFAQKKWTLKECVDYAIKNNISLKQSELDITSAEIAKTDAIGNFLPTINTQGSHSWNIGLNQNITTGLLQNQTTQYTSVGISSGITLYNGLQNQLRFQKSRLTKMAADLQYAKLKDDVSLNVANAYLQIVFNKEFVKAQQEQVSLSEKQKHRTDESVKAGLVPRGDLLDVEATLTANKQKLVDAENNLFLSKITLAQMLQLQEYTTFDVADADYVALKNEVLNEKTENIIEKAKQERNEIKIAQNSVALAEKDIKIAKGAYQPHLSAFYSFNTRASYSKRIVGVELDQSNPTSVIGYVNATGQEVVQPNYNYILGNPLPIFKQFDQYKGHNFGFQLNIPILNGLSVRNNVARTKIALEKSQNALKLAETDLERTIYTAVSNAKGAKTAYESAQTALEARKNAFNYAKEKYEVGMMNSFDFNQAQTLYLTAQSDLLRTKYDYIFKVKIVEFYYGIPISEMK